MRIAVVTATPEGDDGAVVAALRRLGPQNEVVVYRPDVAGTAPPLPAPPPVLEDCDAVYVLDARGDLPEHRYPLYRRLFRDLGRVADRVVPALATLQFVWSKAEVLRLMDAHGIPHPPTFVLERPAAAPAPAAVAADGTPSSSHPLRGPVDALVAWLAGLPRPPRWIVTKPSHATNCQDVQEWDLEYVAGDPAGAARFVAYLRRLFEEQGRPYVLVQPRIHALRYGPEYRHVFIDGAFHACAATVWKRRTDDGEWACVPRPTTEPAVLRATVPLASRLVELLPPDSPLYRVDLFRHRGVWWVTEVETVDADTYGDDSVPEPLAQALLRARLPGGAAAASPFASLPVIDEGDAAAVGLSDNAWLALERHLYAALRRAFPPRPRPRRRRGGLGTAMR